MIIICCEILYSMKIYDWSVLNPINFMMMTLLDKGIANSPDNSSLKLWSMKVSQKLGLTSSFTKTSITVKNLDKKQFEKFGALKYSHFQLYGAERELDATSLRYEKFYSEIMQDNKKTLVNGF